MNLEKLCELRDKLIMDENYSQEQKTFLYGLFEPHIFAARSFPKSYK